MDGRSAVLGTFTHGNVANNFAENRSCAGDDSI